MGLHVHGVKGEKIHHKTTDITINKQRLSLLLKHTSHLLVALVDQSDHCFCKVHSREEDGCYSCGQLVECPDKIFQVVLSLHVDTVTFVLLVYSATLG